MRRTLLTVVGEIERELRRSRGTGSADQALRRLVEIKVQQAMMLREGVIETAGYGRHLSGLAREHARRKAVLRKGKAVFGPAGLEPDYHFAYRFDTEVVALKERLEAAELRASGAELRAFHESVKARFFNRGTAVAVEVLTFTRATGDAERRASEAGRRLRAGADAAVVARSLAGAALRPGGVGRVLDAGGSLVVVRAVARRQTRSES